MSAKSDGTGASNLGQAPSNRAPVSKVPTAPNGAHDRRFAKAKTRDQVAERWNEALACGEVPGGFWATLTHPKSDDALRVRAYEEVHMLSHQIGAGQRADLKRLSDAQIELAQLKRDFDGLRKRTGQQLEEREQLILELESRLRNSEAEHRRSAIRAGELSRQLMGQYRALVARCNGRFDHHDGGLEDNRQRLHSMLSSADAVVCVTDCVSHGASDRLKRFCKQHEKPYVFLRSSGISTFARALESVAR
jgi:hypothetical protein